MHSDQERLSFLIHTLADPDLLFDYTREQVERMEREKTELERLLDHDRSEGMT